MTKQWKPILIGIAAIAVALIAWVVGLWRPWLHANTPSDKSGESVSLEFTASYVHSFSVFGDRQEYPATVVIRSYEELMTYYNTVYSPEYEFRIDHDSELLTTFRRYENYFDDRVLLLILTEHGSGSIRDEIMSITKQDNIVTVTIDALTPECMTMDMAYWHLVVELPAHTEITPDTEFKVVTRRRQTYTDGTFASPPVENPPAFSYAEESASFASGLTQTDRTKFKNQTVLPVGNPDIAVQRAAAECTVKYTRTDVFFDNEVGIWKVWFLPDENILGGDQTVYLDTNGITHAIVYGE